MGNDAYYLPNTNSEARDLIYGEDPLKTFSAAYPIEIYLSSAMEYGGDKEFFSKFGLEIRNNITIVVSKRAFAKRVTSLVRPMEGDLIYVPYTNGVGELFEITFVNQNKDFFTLGRKVPYYYEIELEKFKYSQEQISTGIPGIDSIMSDDAYSIKATLTNGTGNYTTNEIVYQSIDNTLANATMTGICVSWNSPVLTINSIMGSPIANSYVIGNSSASIYTLISTDEESAPSEKELYNNNDISNEAFNVVVNDVSNAFGPMGSVAGSALSGSVRIYTSNSNGTFTLVSQQSVNSQFQTIEIDVGNPKPEYIAIVDDTLVNTNTIISYMINNQTTSDDRSADEFVYDKTDIAAIAYDGYIKFVLSARQGTINGKYVIAYKRN